MCRKGGSNISGATTGSQKLNRFRCLSHGIFDLLLAHGGHFVIGPHGCGGSNQLLVAEHTIIAVLQDEVIHKLITGHSVDCCFTLPS